MILEFSSLQDQVKIYRTTKEEISPELSKLLNDSVKSPSSVFIISNNNDSKKGIEMFDQAFVDDFTKANPLINSLVKSEEELKLETLVAVNAESSEEKKIIDLVHRFVRHLKIEKTEVAIVVHKDNKFVKDVVIANQQAYLTRFVLKIR